MTNFDQTFDTDPFADFDSGDSAEGLTPSQNESVEADASMEGHMGELDQEPRPVPRKRRKSSAPTRKSTGDGTTFTRTDVGSVVSVLDQIRQTRWADDSHVLALFNARANTNEVDLAITIFREGAEVASAIEKIAKDAAEVASLSGFSAISDYNFATIDKVGRASAEDNISYQRVLDTLVEKTAPGIEVETVRIRKDTPPSKVSQVRINSLGALSQDIEAVERFAEEVRAVASSH